jgi:hypothetical protein
MAFAAGPLLLIKDSGPITEADGLGSKLVEGLAQEFGTSPTKVDPLGFAALFAHWSHPEESHGCQGAGKTLSIGAEGCQ